MAYADANTSNRKLVVGSAVLLIEVGLAYALVTGLATTITRSRDTNLQADQFKLDPPKPVDPPPVKPDYKTPPLVDPHFDTRIDLAPETAPTFTPVDVGPVDLTPVREVTFTPPRTEIVKPAFTPKSPTAKGKPALWVTPNDYPASELRLEHEGLTRFRVTVSADGKPLSCSVTASSGWPMLDDTACAKVMSRSAFEPATDETGARAEGSYNGAVRWQIPD